MRRPARTRRRSSTIRMRITVKSVAVDTQRACPLERDRDGDMSAPAPVTVLHRCRPLSASACSLMDCGVKVRRSRALVPLFSMCSSRAPLGQRICTVAHDACECRRTSPVPRRSSTSAASRSLSRISPSALTDTAMPVAAVNFAAKPRTAESRLLSVHCHPSGLARCGEDPRRRSRSARSAD